MDLEQLAKLPPTEKEKLKHNLILRPLESKEELQAWVYLFFDILFPMGVVCPDSTHGPVDAMWEIYRLMKTGESADCPQVCMLSSRDSYKTLNAAALEVLCMLHFEIPVAHMAAIKSQSAKAIQYINGFFRKVRPYLEAHGWTKKSDSKTYIDWITPKGDTVWLNVVTATLAGANSEHVPMLCVDGDTDIMCKNINTKTNRVRRNKKAKSLYKNFMKGKTDLVYTFNHATGTFEFKKILKAFKQEKEVFKVQIEGSRDLLLSEDHPILSINGGYKPLKDFSVGDQVLKLGKQQSNINTDIKLRVEKECKYCKDTFMPFESGNTTYHCNSVLCRSIRYNQLKPKTIKSIESVGFRDVYDFTIEDNHNFFANQILVHNCVDEVDVVQDPRALREAKMIPSVWGKYFPLTVYLSTRKFAGGLMEKTLDETIKTGGKVLRWNIVDVTARITLEEAQANLPKVIRYVTRELPMETIMEDEWKKLPNENKVKYEKVEAYQGIADHPMLPVMRNYLVDRPQTDVGDLYKPLVAVHNNFKQLPPDMGEAQLLCNKPSSSGLVYPRFDSQKNVLTVREALKKLIGEQMEIDSFEYLKDYIKNLGIPIIGGADWGMTDMTSFVILAMLPGGEVWHLDTLAMSGLEIDDIVKYGKELQEDWGVHKWYADQNYPAYLSMLRRKAGWKCPKFTKVVLDGIAGLQSKIVDSSNVRKYFVINTPSNQAVIDAFGVYRWATDGKGDVIEGKPEHGNDGTSDIMDSIRYPAQNLFIKGARPVITQTGKSKKNVSPTIEENKKLAEKLNEQAMKEKIGSLATNDGISKVKKKGKIFWG